MLRADLPNDGGVTAGDRTVPPEENQHHDFARSRLERINYLAVKIEGIVLTEGEFGGHQTNQKNCSHPKKICPEYRDASTHRNFQTYTLTGILGLTASAVHPVLATCASIQMRETKRGSPEGLPGWKRVVVRN